MTPGCSHALLLHSLLRQPALLLYTCAGWVAALIGQVTHSLRPCSHYQTWCRKIRSVAGDYNVCNQTAHANALKRWRATKAERALTVSVEDELIPLEEGITIGTPPRLSGSNADLGSAATHFPATRQVDRDFIRHSR